ncbi:MAG: hypothetical protein RLZZ494_290 [Pseudomonadota bacterium]
MRWKFLWRRWTTTIPTMTISRRLPWPLRWAGIALMLGLSAALALWTFEFGKTIAGLDRDSHERIAELETQVERLRQERDKAQAVANTAESLLTTERTTQSKLAEKVSQLEATNVKLKEDLSVFERLLQGAGKGVAALSVKDLQVDAPQPGRLHYQFMLLLGNRNGPAFSGRYEVTLSGTLGGKPWKLSPPAGRQPVQVKPYQRFSGDLEYPAQAVVKTVQVSVTDPGGTVRATETLSL